MSTARRQKPHRRRASVISILGFCVIAAALSACQNPQNEAEAQAVTNARAGAENVRARFESAADPTKTSEKLRESVVAVLPAGPDNQMSEPIIDGDGNVTVDAVYFTRGEAGGGTSFSQFVVRMCLTYTVSNNPQRATVTDMTCPTNAPTHSSNAGTSNKTIFLAD